MKIVRGNLLKLARDGHFDVIVHGCNCKGAMGAGIARTIASTYPSVLTLYREYLALFNESKTSTLGKICSVAVTTGEGYTFIIVNAFTQEDYGRGIYIDYNALRSAFRRVRDKFPGQRIGYPAVGTGLAGGDWKSVLPIIDEELRGEDHTLVIYKP